VTDTRVYTEGGTVAHILNWDQSPNDRAAEALCGRSAWPGYWFGTGTQDEEERAIDLRLCTRCESVLRLRAGGSISREGS
jgi:hypothetical protein